MKKFLSISFLCLFFTFNAFSQQTFHTTISDDYYAKVYVADTVSVFSPGWIAVYDVATDKELIRVESEELAVGYTDRGEVQINVHEMPYGEQSVIICEDFNFDGVKDLAIQDGQNSCYHGPSYQIYLADKQGGFELSEGFTDLAQIYCGLFETDSEKQRLYTMTKSGCCWHQYNTFDVVDNVPRQIKQVDEAMSFSMPFVNTTVSEWNGKELALGREFPVLYLEDESDDIFSFTLPAKGKMVVLFEYDERLYYAFLSKTGEVEFYYPNDKDSADFVFDKDGGMETLTFSNPSAEYVIYNSPTQVGIKVTTKGKTYDMVGDVSSRREDGLGVVKDKSFPNVISK